MAEHIILSHVFGQDIGVSIIDSRSLDFAVKRSMLGLKKVLDVDISSFKIKIESISDFLCVDPSQLLKLKFFGSLSAVGQEIKGLRITSYNNPYQILLNHNAISDCNDLEKNSAEIKFSVEMKYENETKVVPYKLTINLVKAKPQAQVVFKPMDKDIVFIHETIVIGHLLIENTCPYRYAESTAVTLNAKYGVPFKESLVTLGNKNEIIETNPHFSTKAGLMGDDETLDSCLGFRNEGGRTVTLRQIVAKNEISIPVYLNLAHLENPEKEYCMETFVLAVQNLLDGSISNETYSIKILRDNTTTKLLVNCNGKNISNGDKINCGHIKWVEFLGTEKERFNGTSDLFKILIGNEAKNRGVSSDAAVIIKNVKVNLSFVNGEIVDKQGQASLSSLQLVNPAAADQLLIFPNTPDSVICCECCIRHADIKDIPNNMCTVAFNVSFLYAEDATGTFERIEGEYSYYDASLLFEIEKDPGSEWLCVDYGTSATVAIFGDGTQTDMQLLNLDERNKDLLLDLKAFFQTPRFEEGTKFLSSNLMLRENGIVGSSEFKNSIVWLSPSEPLFNSTHYTLPYMKALVGYKDFPNSEKFASFKYKLNSSGNNTTYGINPIDVDTVFKATYKSLFLDYIKPAIGYGKIINKLVLTVPNTYTPHHIKCLREIVQAEIPTLRKDYIWFVSESDAIAYYYLNRWNRLNLDRNNDFTDREEHVLVYDMGAGTLDLTYLSINRQSNNETKVKMISKIGLNKAGDYLDYILAKALVKTHPNLFPEAILEPTNDVNLRRLAGLLKRFIKVRLKRCLFDDVNEICFEAWNGETLQLKDGNTVDFKDQKLNLQLVRTDEEVKAFICECTDVLFDNFIKINDLKPESSPIDTLLMTGRGVQFGPISACLKKRISKWNKGDRCYVIDIKGDDLKTVVVQGAMYYATLYGNDGSIINLENRNIYASYGVIYVNAQGHTRYQELINASTEPIGVTTQQTAQCNGIQIYSYDTKVHSADEFARDITVDLRNTPMAYLVQSYSPDTAADYDKKKFDYISVMAEFNPRSVVSTAQDCRSISLRLQVTKQNQMIFSAGVITNEATSPLKIDIKKNETFRHSMWPFV